MTHSSLASDDATAVAHAQSIRTTLPSAKQNSGSIRKMFPFSELVAFYLTRSSHIEVVRRDPCNGVRIGKLSVSTAGPPFTSSPDIGADIGLRRDRSFTSFANVTSTSALPPLATEKQTSGIGSDGAMADVHLVHPRRCFSCLARSMAGRHVGPAPADLSGIVDREVI